MRMKLVYLSRKDEPWIDDGVEHYTHRVRRYCPFELRRVDYPKPGKNPTDQHHRHSESTAIEAAIPAGSHVIALDKAGKLHSSEELAKLIAKLQGAALKEVAFVIGGPYGFTKEFLKRAKAVISLSPMTFPHQLARLVFTEQLYRAFTILRSEAYHHP